MLGFYGTDNKFTYKDIVARSIHIRDEFEKRGLTVLCFGSDGDKSFLKAQKHLLNFGTFVDFDTFKLAGNINSLHQASQDPMHIRKKMKSFLYDLSDLMQMGEFYATLSHLIMVFKIFHKNQHGLNKTDLDPKDKMNYK